MGLLEKWQAKHPPAPPLDGVLLGSEGVVPTPIPGPCPTPLFSTTTTSTAETSTTPSTTTSTPTPAPMTGTTSRAVPALPSPTTAETGVEWSGEEATGELLGDAGAVALAELEQIAGCPISLRFRSPVVPGGWFRLVRQRTGRDRELTPHDLAEIREWERWLGASVVELQPLASQPKNSGAENDKFQ